MILIKYFILGDYSNSINTKNGNSKNDVDQKENAEKLSREITSKITPKEKREMESDGGIDINELNTVLSKSNINSPTEVTKMFNKLDTNKNGKLEQSELRSKSKGGEDYFIGGLFSSLVPVLIQNLPSILQLGGTILQGALSQGAKGQGAKGQGAKGQGGSDQSGPYNI